MTGMGAALDENGKLMAPSAGFDNKKFGTDCAEWVIDYAEKTWPEAKPEEIGMLSINYSVVPQLQARTDGAREVWLNKYPSLEKNFFDAAPSPWAARWTPRRIRLRRSCDVRQSADQILACLRHLRRLRRRRGPRCRKHNLDQTTVVICPGGASAIAHWEAGEQSCWKAVIYSGDGLFSEPIWNGLYAQLHGDATMETLWPEWVNKAAGEKYPYLLVPTIVLTYDTYKQFIAWEEEYTGIKRYFFEWDGVTTFPGRAEVPASYKG
jgi:hypothetical protein